MSLPNDNVRLPVGTRIRLADSEWARENAPHLIGVEGEVAVSGFENLIEAAPDPMIEVAHSMGLIPDNVVGIVLPDAEETHWNTFPGSALPVEEVEVLEQAA